MNFSNKIITIAVLFLPNSSLELYLLMLLIAGWIVGHHQVKFGYAALIFILLYGCYFICRQFFSGVFNTRDLTEIFRLLTFYAFFRFMASPKQKGEGKEELFSFIAKCSIVIFVISFIQSSIPNSLIGSSLLNIYMSDGHLERSFIGNNRASGVSTGPGQAGTLGSFLFAVNLTYFYFFHNRNVILQVIALLSCVGIVILAQSQTGFITICVLTTYSLIYSRKLSGSKFIILAAVIAGCVTLVIWLASVINLRYLFTLFAHGLERSSFQKRLYKWETFMDNSLNQPFLWLFGHGKDYFGDTSAAVDSDIIFLIGVYGPILTGILMCFILYQFYKALKIQTSRGALVALTILTGAILSIPTAFLFDTKVLALLIVVFLSTRETRYNEKNCSISASK